jgi:hypothetical protein
MEMKVIIVGLWDRLGGWLLIGLGALAILLGWLGVSDTALTSEQLPYVVSGGLFGLGLIGTGATLLISSGLRDEWRKLDDIEAAILQLDGLLPDSPLPDSRTARARRSEPLHASTS